MNNKIELNSQELEDVNGGSWGSNKYEASVYHDAGICTNYFALKVDHFFFAMPNNHVRHLMYHDEANSYVEYRLSHTPEEYIAHVQEVIPQYNEIIKGYDI